jgi:hypothetical protein
MNDKDVARGLMNSFAETVADPVALLAASHYGLVSAAEKLGLSRDDLFSLCWSGVAIAASKYQSDGTAAFHTYAVCWMRGEVSAELRRRSRGTNRRLRFVPIEDHDVPADVPAGWHAEWAEADAAIRSALPKAVVVALYSGFGVGGRLSEGDVCKRLRTTPAVVGRLRKVGLEMARSVAGAGRS